MDREKYISEQVELFRTNLEQSLDVSVDPENLKWAIFSTGSQDTEEGVLSHLVDLFLPHVKGVYIFRADDARECVSLMKESIKDLESKVIRSSLESDSRYEVRFGSNG